MKVRIPKIALSLAFAVPASYAAVHIVRTVNASDAIDTRLVLCRRARPLSAMS